MCWIGIFNLKTAQEDIRVYKIMVKSQLGKDDFISIYKRFPYKKGNIYTSKIYPSGMHNTGETEVHLAIHSYSEGMTKVIRHLLPKEVNKRITADEKVIITTKQGIFIDFFFNGQSIAKVPCIIPKGAKYCVNEKGEVISDTLKIL